MPRRKRKRMALMPPTIKGMSVTGVRGRRSNEVFLLLEEYEAIRLLDYLRLNQEQAAFHMQVSRPTITRIYQEARQKVARAFFEGRDIVIKGGLVAFKENWFQCNMCRNRFSFAGEGSPVCQTCNSIDIQSLNAIYQVTDSPPSPF